MAEWHEDDGFWNTIESAVFSKSRFATATQDIEQIVALLALEANARVLDLCCGPGRHACELARLGFRVTGVDRMASYLAHARDRAQKWELDIEFVEDDMRRFVREDEFDAIVNLYTSFGYFEDDAENQRVLENARHSLTRGGRLLIEILGKESVAKNWRGRWWKELEDGSLICEERVVADGFDRLDSRWIIVDPDGTRHSVKGIQRIYSATEMKAMLRAAGFADIAVYGSLSGGPYDRDAERMVAVGTNPQ